MKLSLIASAVIFCTTSLAQHHPFFSLGENYRRYIDSIASLIDRSKLYEITADSINIYDFKMDKVAEQYIERFYFDSSKQLRKVVASRTQHDIQSFYFNDGLLIKAVILERPKSDSSIVYYFTEDDNQLDIHFLRRVQWQFPQYEDWLYKLLIAKEFLQSKSISLR